MRKFSLVVIPLVLLTIIGCKGEPTVTGTDGNGSVLVTSISVQGVEELFEGESYTFTATVKPTDATNKTITWASSDTSIATITEEGIVTAIKAGEVTIKASANDGSKKYRNHSLTVKAKPVAVSSITIEGDSEVEVGKSITLTANINPSTATNKNVTWSTSDFNIATISSTTGVLSAKKQGTVTITATAKDGSGVKGSKVITVKPFTQSTVNLMQITGTEVYYSPVGWEPRDTYTLTTSSNGEYIFGLPEATQSQWQAQLKLNTGMTIQAGKSYSFVMSFLPNTNLANVTIKFEAPGAVLFDEKYNLTANEENSFELIATASSAMTNPTLVLDFGGNPTCSVKISDIKLFEYVKEPTGTDEITNDAPATLELDGEILNFVWSDEFTSAEADGTPLKSKWGYDVGMGQSTNTDGTNPGNWAWGNGELQWYSEADPKNTYVSNGTLKLSAIRDNDNWTSGRIVTRNIPGAQFKYGYIEMKAKIPYDAGVWPAFWMLDNDIYNGQGWPLSGEIDIMETSVNLWQTKVYGTLHCNAGNGGNPVFTRGTTDVGFEDGLFHTYAVNWTEDHIDWYYDGKKVFTYEPADFSKDRWPFNEEFYIIINLAVGGNLGGAVPADLTSSTMEIDYVRVYQ